MAPARGRNEFIVTDTDVEDMVEASRRCKKKNIKAVTLIWESYLASEFKARHPLLYANYINNDATEPVTLRQIRYYLKNYADLFDDSGELPGAAATEAYRGLSASGPGEVYEIDATGGRIHLVSTEEIPRLLGTPTIYIVIDRWSRFIVAIYVSLRPASFEEVRYPILISFTSRERFKGLGVDVDDKRWPVGVMPATFCPDRGSEFVCKAMESSVVKELKIESTPLPPLTPDGKAIIERLNRELKRRMTASGLGGVFAERPMDPVLKRVFNKAKDVAVENLATVYRFLIDFAIDHNNRSHKYLRRYNVLTQNGIPPTPQAAYLWGLKNITGLRSPALSEEDYRRLLLNYDTAKIKGAVLFYNDREYNASDEAAHTLIKSTPKRGKSFDIRIDLSAPRRIYVPVTRGRWAQFDMAEVASKRLGQLTLDEEAFYPPGIWSCTRKQTFSLVKSD